MKSLTDLYLNKPLSALTPPYTFGNTPTTAALRVPAGQVNQYKNDSNWGRFTTITPGGYDFSLSSGISSNYHMGRAIRMAREAGFADPLRVPAPSEPLYYGANVMWEVIMELNAMMHG
jgi:hypothetical protein